ncbi:MAG: hypothetical protein NTZ42_01750 [Candidatus Gribaldobacteria bacterium]|nr:hypothetical protein [Candidatus Gribaldobacteria bacterium]
MTVVGFYDSFIGIILSLAWAFFLTWWWLILPFIFYFPARFFHFWWIRWEVWYKEEKWILLELIPPGEVLKPYLAMEDIITALWPIYDGANWRERWCEGEMIGGPFWLTFEIVSIEGQVHFYMRILKDQKDFVSSIFHTHYPEIEIFEVEDYTQNISQDIPNDTYDLYGEYLTTSKPYSYPIKTYKYFEIRPEEVDQEKKLDPFSNLMEAMVKLKEGEQLWYQINLTPISNNDIPWLDEGRALADKIARRGEKAPRQSMIGETIKLAVLGKQPYSDEAKAESIIPPEMKLTPGEREKLAAVETKISQLGFKVFMRSVYIYTKDAYVSPNKRIPRSYLVHFGNDMQSMRDWSKEKTKIHYFFRKRRVYTRKKKIFDLYVRRLPPMFPEMWGPGNMLLNAEEIATIFHFPSNAANLPAGVPRIMAKKFGPPPNLPV